MFSHREYEDKEYLSSANKKVFLRDFGQDGLNFDAYEKKVSGGVIYPILSTNILSDVQYQLDDKKSLHIYISTRETESVDHTNIASYRELIYIKLNNIKSRPDSVIVYLNEKPMSTKGGVHTTVTW
ncbi:hypothetical protein KAS31_01890 [Candidatus Parcubacteria bacterium]|nr:hypothetical protein [Candidatus Parcubacteria bacterium]